MNVVLGISLVLLVSSAIYLITKRTKSIPYSVFLVIVGILISPLHIEPFEAIRLNPGSVLFIFLPILLFESAFNFEFKEFRKILTPGFALATIGLVISAIIIALPLVIFFKIEPVAALLFGSVISSTDPIAVLSIFKNLGVPKRLQLLVDGESFLNDGTSVILFRILLPFVTGVGGELASGEFIQGLGSFAYVLLGGVVAGVVFGLVFSYVISQIKNVSSVEVALTIILAHLVFIVSDHYLKVSGIIAVLAAGLVLGNYGRTKISPKVSHNMHQMWDFLVFVSTSIVFLLIGYEISIGGLFSNIEVVAVTIVALLLGRAVSVYLVTGVFNLFASKEQKISAYWMHIANWGGLRGSLPLIVILSLPETLEFRELFIQLTLGVILFTLIFNGLTIKPLIKLLGVDRLNRVNEIEVHFTKLFILKNLCTYINDLREIGEIGEQTYQKHLADVKSKLKDVIAKISTWLTDNSQSEYNLELERIIRRYCVQIEKAVYADLYKKDVITESVYTRLKQTLDYQIECINCATNQFGRKTSEKMVKDLLNTESNQWVILKGIKKIFLGQDRDQQIAEYYMHHKARLLGDEKVIEELEEFNDEELNHLTIKMVKKVQDKYRKLEEYNEETIFEIEQKYPHLAAEVDERFYVAESHELIERILEEFGEQNRVSVKALQNLDLDLK